MPRRVPQRLFESHLVEGEMPVRSALPAAAKQHYAIDIAGGVAVAAACFGLVRLCLRFRCGRPARKHWKVLLDDAGVTARTSGSTDLSPPFL